MLWEELLGLCGWWNVTWCVGGDFNVVRFPSERLSSVFLIQAMHQLSDFISKHGLIDLPLEGGSFTWSNSLEVVSRSRLDRFLVTRTWEVKFPSICQKRLSRLLSDHFPIILEGGNFHRGMRPFRFENMWLKDEGFVEKIRSWWESYQFYGAPSFVLANKLKALKVDLKRWNVEELLVLSYHFYGAPSFVLWLVFLIKFLTLLIKKKKKRRNGRGKSK